MTEGPVVVRDMVLRVPAASAGQGEELARSLLAAIAGELAANRPARPGHIGAADLRVTALDQVAPRVTALLGSAVRR